MSTLDHFVSTTRRRTVSVLALASLLALGVLPSSFAGASSQAPAGNNGHIQIDQYALDGGSGNDPHLACGFSVSFFGFDTGTQQAFITVTPVAPTTGGTPFTQSTSWTISTRTSGDQLDQNVIVTPAALAAAFSGVTPAHEGFHARIAVDVTGAKGADSKYHTIWIAPCSSTTTTTTPGSTTTTTPGSTTTTTGVPSGTPATATLGSGTVHFLKLQRLGGTTNTFLTSSLRVLVGQQVQYELRVTNATTASLSVVVTDPGCDLGTLSPIGAQTVAAGATATYFCSHLMSAVPTGRRFLNVATALATNTAGESTGPLTSAVTALVNKVSLRSKALSPAQAAKPELKQATFTG
ncbi:MAG TPA: hypothetical protein PLG60_05590 [Acidimicrobiales bacterium]|nr:hypothetical protein [Acidimicrobiales bacterium]